ncbi:hypothetical protein RhiirC2_715758 [Rhizophagus irregularis]|uniref:Ion transport domain-containing protein n=1 Tax=Rhizophagus irregularis TaxID=588596 RepID=A0A2N1MU58_9GLOM|nr:hypothetical protein RhiirC2_715758 [Rhizophagus irregularis]
MNEFSVEIDKTIKNDKIDDDIDKPHNGKQITMIEVSQNGRYLVTYSPEDDSIVGWNVKGIDGKEGQLKPESNYHHIGNSVKLTQLSVSDDKEIAYICENKLNIQLYNFIKHTFHIGLFPLLYPLLNSGFRNSVMKYWKKCLNRLSEEYQNDILPDIIQITTSGYAFGILDGYVWKIKIFDELDNEIYDKIKTKVLDSNAEETFENLNIYLFNPLLDNRKKAIELNTNSTKWEIKITDGKLEFQISNNEWNYKNSSKFNEKVHHLYEKKLLNDNDMLIITDIGIFIYHFNENNECIHLIYFYYTKLNKDDAKKILDDPKYTLPLPNYNSFKLSEEWVSYIKNNRESLLKYGAELLSYAIEEHNLELMDDIYKKCLNHFKQDLKNNKVFLSIITSKIPEYYPEYILRYSLDTTMIIDSPLYSMKRDLHFHTFKHLHMIYIPPYLLNFHMFFLKLLKIHKIFYYIWVIIQCSMLPILFIFFCTIYPFSSTLNDFIYNPVPYTFNKIFKAKPTPTITFMIPYIKFVNYPQKYNFFKELFRPQPNQFVKTINRDFYKSWSGEALINSKWNAYGRQVYLRVWLLEFMVLLGYFTAAATIPQQYISDFNRNLLLIFSTCIGLYHLIHEIRQFTYDPKKWYKDFWNYFDVIACVLPIYTSIYWLQTETGFTLEEFVNNNDPNNPWNLTHTYSVLDNGAIHSNLNIIEQPNENTNMFINYKTAIFATYLFLTGDSSALTNWKYTNNPSLVILIVLFSLLIVVYLMNLFIGLLNLEIGKYNDRVSFLMQKAEILAEIELFHLSPSQRRLEDLFPEVLYYCADIDVARAEVKKLIKDGQWSNELPEMRKDLYKQLHIQRNPAETDLRELLEEVQSRLKYILNL